MKKGICKLLTAIFLFNTTLLLNGGSATESFLKFVPPAEIEQRLWPLSPKNRFKKYKAMVQKVIEQEKKFFDTHYVFYHATIKDLHIVHEIYKKLLCYLKKNCWEKFEYLRPKNLLFKEMTTIDEFFDFRDKLTDKTDHNPQLRTILLSTNLSFPGNLEHEESTFYYFTNPITQLTSIEEEQAIRSFIKAALLQFPAITNLDEEFIDTKSKELANLRYELAHVKSGILLQIFIPKNLVDTYVYLSSEYGIPYGQNPLEKDIIKKFPTIWSEEKGRFIEISTIIDNLQNNLKTLGLDKEIVIELQARIILSKALFASPKNNVKIFKYHMIDEGSLELFETYLNKILQEIIQEINKRGKLLLKTKL